MSSGGEGELKQKRQETSNKAKAWTESMWGEQGWTPGGTGRIVTYCQTGCAMGLVH